MKITKYSKSEKNLKDIQRICRDFKYFEYYSIFFKDPYYLVYLASIEEKNIGVMVLSRHSYNLYGDFLWVDEDYRSKKIGSQMLEMAIEMGRKEGYRSFIGDAVSTNIQAHRLYERIGFIKYGEFTNIYGEGQEIIHMFRIVYPENLELNLK